ncbi:MAG: prsA [Elusimicrobia bacterium]|nr:MAG: prsA [Elusimicrobiota bacterium]
MALPRHRPTAVKAPALKAPAVKTQPAKAAPLPRPVDASLRIFTGNANRPIAEKVAAYLGTSLSEGEVGRFADGEINVAIKENVRGKDCYVVQPTCRPTNENLMELLIMIDALRRASAGRITAVMPYFGYARADRKSAPRVPITARLVAKHLRAKQLTDVVAVSPDVGGVERARAFAKRLGAGLAIVDKRRPRPNEASIYNVIGDVKGKAAVILDDMVDTGGTLTKVANRIKEMGATRVLAACVHGVLSGGALDLVESSALEELIVTDSIPLPGGARGKVKVLSIAPLLGEAIRRNHRGESISELFV